MLTTLHTMRILLLGGNGYVGSALYSALTDHDVVSWDMCLWGRNLGYSVQQDVRNISTSDVAAYHMVIMLSAHSSVGMCKHDPAGAILNNVINTQHVLNCLREDQLFIYASSTGIYGKQPTPCTELDASYQHMNWYDITKQTVDTHMQQLIKQNRQVMGLRFGTVCGVSENTRSDLFLNNMVRNACANKHFWVNNLHVSRSVLAINDLTRAVKTICEKPFVSGIYNLKSFDVTMAQAADQIHTQLCVPYETRDPDALTYDFTVNQHAFCSTYDWQPESTLVDVIDQLAHDHRQSEWCARPMWCRGTSYAI